MASNIVWGLDIGSSAIKAVKMKRLDKGECSIIDFDIIDIPGGDDPADRPARLSVAMKQLVETHKFGSDPVFLAIPGAVCLHREFILPPSAEARVHEMVSFEAKQQIPFPLDQVEWGYERFSGSGDDKAINVTLIAVRKSDIQELLTLSENFNLKLAGICAAPVSLYNFIHYEFKPQNITLILDAGARGTDFVVMNKRQIYFRSIQIAGREITRVLENKFKVPYEKAESLKKNIEKSPQMDQILTVIEPTLRNLGADVQRTIGFYKAKSKGQKIQQCYLLGHAFRLPKMADYLATQVREAPFASVEGLQRIRLDPKVDAAVWENEFPTMAVAIGLGIQGLGLSEMALNLIPQEKEGETSRQTWKLWSAIAAAVLLISLGVTYYFANSAVAKYAAIGAELKAAADKVAEAKRAENEAITPSDKTKKSIQEKIEQNQRLARLAHDKGKIENIFGQIPGLKGSDGKPFFGKENKIYLTNLYASRTPLNRDHKISPARYDKLDREDAFKRMYEAMNPAPADPFKVAPEFRPDAPLVVIISGEVEVKDGQTAAARTTLGALEELLKNHPNTKSVLVAGVPTKKVEFVYNAETQIPYEEHVLRYDEEGKLVVPITNGQQPAPGDPNAPPPEEVKKYSFVPFHFMLIWEDPEDKDINPPPPPKAP